MASLAPLASPLAPIPDDDVLTQDQWQSLLAICEVFVPSVDSNALSSSQQQTLADFLPFVRGNDVDLRKEYLEENIVAHPAFKESIRRSLALWVPKSNVKGLIFILSSLSTRLGSLLLTGSATPIQKQSLATRTAVIAGWQSSYLPLLRNLHFTFLGLTKKSWLSASPTLLRVMDFPDFPKDIVRNPSYHFKFHDFSFDHSPQTLTADVVIIGSGCGAGVVASHLSRSGLKCIVLEKSYHYSSAHFPMSQTEAGELLFENGTALLSDDGGTALLAGSNFGGGGTINWSASLQPPRLVREEWASTQNLPHFLSAEYQDCLDFVCQKMGVAKSSDPEALARIKHNFTNQVLIEGARRLGMSHEVVPQNTGGKDHSCGSCTLGCPSCTKQGPANCWLPDAAEHGAEFVEGCWVDQIIFRDADRQTAEGVRCTWTSRDRTVTKQVEIRSPKIVVSAGTLHSPLVLRRSGFRHRWLGKNLHLHPVASVVGTWDHRVNPWEGAILTTAVTHLKNVSGDGHGPVVEVLASVPLYAVTTLPYRVGADPLDAALELRINAAKWSHCTPYVLIQRDKGAGEVYQDPDDARMVRFKYATSPADRHGLLAAQLATARILHTMGAREIECAHHRIPRYVRARDHPREADERAFERWLHLLQTKGLTRDPEGFLIGTAHQMGTCRMGARPDLGVVDGAGKVWGAANVWVADASVLPSATGVNPMVTTMATAEWVARAIVRDTTTVKSESESLSQSDGARAY